MARWCLEIVEPVLYRGRIELDQIFDGWLTLPKYKAQSRLDCLLEDKRTAPWVIESYHPLVINLLNGRVDSILMSRIIRQSTDAQICHLLTRLNQWDRSEIIEQFVRLRRWSLYRSAYRMGGRLWASSALQDYGAVIFPIFLATSRAKTLVADIRFMVRPFLMSP